MKKRLLAILLVFMMAVCAFPVSAFAAGIDAGGSVSPNNTWVYYIKGNNVNLRSGPGTSFSSGGQVNNGDTLDLIFNSNGNFVYEGDGYTWYHVHMTSGQCAGSNGYVAKNYVTSKSVPSID